MRTTIGVVSDEPHFLKTVTARLQADGYRVVTSPGDYDDCLALIWQEYPAGVVVDARCQARSDVQRLLLAPTRYPILIDATTAAGLLADDEVKLNRLVAQVRLTGWRYADREAL